MTRFLIKPIVYMLVFGLLGCTSTKWVAQEGPVTEGTIPLVRVTLNDGERIELKDAVVTDESLSGTKGFRHYRGKPYSVTVDQVRSIEIGDTQNSPGKNVFLFLGTLIVVLFAVAASQGGGVDWGGSGQL